MIHNKNFPFDKNDDSEIIHVRASSGNPGAIRKIFLTVVVLAGIGFGIKYIYQHSRGETDPSKIPYAVANIEPYRKRPADPGGMDIPHMDKEIYENLDNRRSENREAIIPTAPPEKPISHDSIADIIDAEERKTNLPEPPHGQVISPSGKKYVKISGPSDVPSTKPKVYKIDPSGKVEVVGKEAQAKTKAVDVNKILQRQITPEFWAQLGTFSTETEATKAWQQMREKNSDIIGDTNIKISRSDLGSEGVSYRLQAGPLSSEVEAKNFCKKLNEHEKSCFYVQGSAK